MTADLQRQLKAGIQLFNTRQFYDCHDVIEEVWLQESSDRQLFLQGLIQAAVAFHHYESDHWGAARTMFGMALKKLSSYPDDYAGFELGRLKSALRNWKSELDNALERDVRPHKIDLSFPTIELLS